MSQALARINQSAVDETGLGFAGSAANVGALATQAGTAAGVAREEGELKAALVLARANPRNEHESYMKIVNSCKRPTMAADATYSFPRGGSQVEGPSVYLAREMARCWGNIRTGIRIVTMDSQYVHVKGYAMDLESNRYVESEAKFMKRVQRKVKQDDGSRVTQWVEPDERDLRELVNKQGSICVRNAILEILPPDFTEDAITQARKTLREASEASLKANPAEVVKKLTTSFDELGVTVAMLEAKLGHALSLVTPDEVATLRQIYSSMKDGNSKREEHFDVGGPAAQQAAKPADEPKKDEASKAQALAEKIAKKRAAKEPEKSAMSGEEFLDSMKQ